MDTVHNPVDKPKIFISGAARIARHELVTEPELAGFEPYLYRYDIAAAEDWEARLGTLVQSADTAVFSLSLAAVESECCRHAARSTAISALSPAC